MTIAPAATAAAVAVQTTLAGRMAHRGLVLVQCSRSAPAMSAPSTQTSASAHESAVSLALALPRRPWSTSRFVCNPRTKPRPLVRGDCSEGTWQRRQACRAQMRPAFFSSLARTSASTTGGSHAGGASDNDGQLCMGGSRAMASYPKFRPACLEKARLHGTPGGIAWSYPTPLPARLKPAGLAAAASAWGAVGPDGAAAGASPPLPSFAAVRAISAHAFSMSEEGASASSAFYWGEEEEEEEEENEESDEEVAWRLKVSEFWGQQQQQQHFRGGYGAGLQRQQGRVLVIDGSAMLYRSFYKVDARLRRAIAYGGNVADQDEDVAGTVFHFIETLVSFLILSPTHVAVVFDHPGTNFRHELYSEYKANRRPMPDAVRQAHPLVHAAVHAMGLQLLRVSGVEGDDVIATVSRMGLQQGMKVRIVSPDKDFFQLLAPDLSLVRPDNCTSFTPASDDDFYAGGFYEAPLVRGYSLFGESDFATAYPGLPPHRFVDVMSLWGDGSDNIPGARGIGRKTAPLLISQFGSVEELMARTAEVKSNRFRLAVERSVDSILLSKQLVELQCDVDIGAPFTDFTLSPPQDGGVKFWKLMDATSIAGVTISSSCRSRIRELWNRRLMA